MGASSTAVDMQLQLHPVVEMANVAKTKGAGHKVVTVEQRRCFQCYVQLSDDLDRQLVQVPFLEPTRLKSVQVRGSGKNSLPHFIKQLRSYYTRQEHVAMVEEVLLHLELRGFT